MISKEEYKRLMMKAMTTPTRPTIIARMRRENCTTDVLLGRPEHAPAPVVPLFRSYTLTLESIKQRHQARHHPKD
jgi:hypothetical protein